MQKTYIWNALYISLALAFVCACYRLYCVFANNAIAKDKSVVKISEVEVVNIGEVEIWKKMKELRYQDYDKSVSTKQGYDHCDEDMYIKLLLISGSINSICDINWENPYTIKQPKKVVMRELLKLERVMKLFSDILY